MNHHLLGGQFHRTVIRGRPAPSTRLEIPVTVTVHRNFLDPLNSYDPDRIISVDPIAPAV